MTFEDFQSRKPAQAIFRRLGIASLLMSAVSWEHLRAMVVAWNDPDVGHFVDAVKRAVRTASAGEVVLLHAVCCAMDFAWLADKLAKGKAWQRMDDTDGEWRQAVAACILGR